MVTAITPSAAPSAGSSSLAAELALARAERVLLVKESHAAETRRAYERDWEAFRAWCARLAPLEPTIVDFPTNDETLSLYVGALAKKRPSTVRRAIAAIRLAHERAGVPALLEGCPATVAALRGHARRHAEHVPRQVAAAVAPRLERMVDACDPDTLLGLRNRALLLVGADLGVRRSELVALDIEHLAVERRGFAVTIARSKGDQTGKRATLALLARPGSVYCPVAALERWLAARERPTTGPVFVGLQAGRCREPGVQRLSDRAVARVIQGAAKTAGLAGDFSGHSLRRGMVTDALEAGEPPHLVQRRARHRTIDSTLAYAEVEEAFAARGADVRVGGEPTTLDAPCQEG